ncbi:MAG TPA: hypothetical protein VID24_12755 [Candidatus Eremiobacteraceae bacterium]|jgi:hypothetical protein
MRVTRIGYALGVAAAVAVFAGCSGNGSSLGSVAQSPSMGGQSIVRNHPASVIPSRFLKAFPNGNYQVTGHNWQSVKPDVNTTYVIGCQFFSGVCNMYKQNHNTVVGQIFATYPNDICVDAAGNVYIPEGTANNINVYPHGSTTVSRTLSGDGLQPSTCAVGSDGTVYVGDIVGAQVQVYAPASNTPTSFLSEPNAVSGDVGGVSIDEHKNLAVTFSGPSAGAGVDVYTHAHQAGRHLLVNTSSVSGVTWDKQENAVITDLGISSWEVFNGSVCNTQSVGNSGDAVFSALNKPNTRIISGDFLNSELTQQSYAFCTGGGTIQKEYTSGFIAGDDVEGVVLSPGQTN